MLLKRGGRGQSGGKINSKNLFFALFFAYLSKYESVHFSYRIERKASVSMKKNLAFQTVKIIFLQKNYSFIKNHQKSFYVKFP